MQSREILKRDFARAQKIETYDKVVEVAASNLAGKRHSTPQERQVFATTVMGSAKATANYIIRRSRKAARAS